MNPSWKKNYARYRIIFLNSLNRYNKRDDLKAYLEILLSLATISIFTIFALKPTLVTIAKLFKEIETKQEVLEIINKKIRNLSSARSLYDKEIGKISLLDTAIPKSAKPESFVGQIEALSAKHQIETTKLSLKDAPILGKQTSATSKKSDQKEPFPKDANSIPFSLGTTAPVDQFTPTSNFISDFESLRRPAKIDSLRISAKRGESGTTISLIIEGRIPYFISQTQ